MSLTNDTSTTMLVQPANGCYGSSGGFGNMFGGDGGWFWIVILFLFCFNGGWGNGWGGNGGGMNGGVGSEVQRGFDHSSVVQKLDGITNGLSDGFYAVNSALSNGFHGVDSAICNLGYNVQNGFNQTNIALMQGQNALSAQLAQCCCDTRSEIQGVKYDMATQACDTRRAIQDSTRQIIDFITTDKLATLQAENQALKTQNFIAANQDAQTAELLRRLAVPTPVPAYQVPSPYASYGFGCNPCGF